MKLNQLLVTLATAILFGCGGSGEESQPQSSNLPQDISTPPSNEGAPEERMMNSPFKWSHKAYVEKV